MDAPEALGARLASGELLLTHFHHLREAEEEYRQAFELDPHNRAANAALAYILGLSARVREAVPFRLELIRQNQHGPHHLILLAKGDDASENPQQLKPFLAAVPNDPLARLGQAYLQLDQQRYAEAEALLESLARERSNDLEVQSRRGRRLAESGSAEFLRWNAELPATAETHPEVWSARGQWAADHAEPRVAIRCFWEVLLRDPNHVRANYRLGQLLQNEGEPSIAAPFVERSRLLTDYVIAVEQAYLGSDLRPVRQAAQLSEELALFWESLGWYQLVIRYLPDGEPGELEAWAVQGESRLLARTVGLKLERTPAEFNPARQVDLSHYPLPDWTATTQTAPLQHATSVEESSIHFKDLAGELRIDFQYFDGVPRDQQTHRMYEFSGGGAAAIDYDNDGWTDIYMTQGSDWPPAPSQTRDLDRIYRNLGEKFVDVTEQAGIREGGFSQGVAAGDYDGDGFCDLYVGNIGPNTFFRNNGDGTFTEITDAAGTAGNQWTTSCLIADLNGDRLPDLYLVNYLTGPDVYDRTCPEPDGRPRSCTPPNFNASQDQLFVNRGDGTFRNVTSISGIEVPNGKGLGIVAADFDSSGRLSLFVANDTVPNFFFVNQAAAGGSELQFTEQAMTSGLAVDADGQSQACMGVAAGDADGDGRLDLFVTNFFNQFNTLYRQQESGLFADESRAAGLAQPSLKQLGFGTQFVDGELDGLPDLIVVNGDVDDFTHTGRPYAMLPQYFRNLGGGRFTEVAGEAAGLYFTKAYLGRGMARIDWDRDGREDVIVSHLDATAALVTNRTAHVGNFLQLRLVGTASERMAIGTTVTLEAGGRTWVKQLTAGDGYQASNERMLTFGLGNATAVDRIVIQWPAGTSQEFTAIDVNQTLLCIEGNSMFIPIRVDR
ncbi:MAG: FG-GAP-like repeat-containing protein [Planctomycetaceae bacterium]